jgi:hypothetical protein
MSYPLPDKGTDVRFVTAGGETFETHVQDVVRDVAVLVAVPQGHQPADPRPPVTLSWFRPDAEYRVPALLCGIDENGWLELRPTGELERIQRRRHVRAGLVMEVTLTGGDGRSVAATTLDVSESGMRCRLRASAALPADDLLAVALSFGGESFVVAARVLWARPGEDGTQVAALHFTEHAQADTVRKWVFEFQLRERNQLRAARLHQL